LGRSVEDVALLLSAIAGPDPRSPISLAEPGAAFAPPLESPLAGLRVAWSPDLGGAVDVDPEAAAVVPASAAVFEHLGAQVEQACPDFAGADEVFRTLRAWSFARGYGPHVREHRELVKPSIVWNVEAGWQLTGEDLARAEELHTELFHRVRRFFEQFDVLLLPVSRVAPFDAELEYPTTVAGVAQETYLDWMRSAYFVSVTGCPALSVPAGFTPDGLPVGVQIVGPHRADRRVLEVGYAFEQATRVGERRPVLEPVRSRA
jgi:amidase